MNEEAQTNAKKATKPFLYKLGMVLLLLAVICWIIAAVATVLPLSLALKAGIITGSLIVGEILFWIGAVFVGKEVVTKYKRFLNPKNWFKKRKRDHNEQ